MKNLLRKSNLSETGLQTKALIRSLLILPMVTVIFFSEISCNSGTQKTFNVNSESNELNSHFMKLQEKFSNQLLLKAIYHIDKQNEFGLLKVPEDIDYMFFDEVISKAIVNNHNIVDSLLFVMQNQQNYTIVFQEISNWCEDFILLEIPSKIDDSSVNLEEIIYEIPMTHHVVLSFLNHEHQDWGSLSETQIYELPYRVCSYLSTLSTNERIHFYSIFFKTLLQRVNIEEE